MNEVDEGLLNAVTDLVLKAIAKKLLFWSHFYFGERLTRQDLRDHVLPSVWMACRENKELTKPEDIVPYAIKQVIETSDVVDRYKRSQRRAFIRQAKHTNTESVYQLPWGTTFIHGWSNQQRDHRQLYNDIRPVIEPIYKDSPDPDDIEYEQILANTSACKILADLLDQGIDQVFALAVVLYYAYDYSIPKIMYLMGISEETVGPKKFLAIREQIRAAIGTGKQEIIKVLSDEQIKTLSRRFNS